MSKRPTRAAAPRYFSSWRQAEAKAVAADALVANDAWGEIAAHVFQDLEATSAWPSNGAEDPGAAGSSTTKSLRLAKMRSTRRSSW